MADDQLRILLTSKIDQSQKSIADLNNQISQLAAKLNKLDLKISIDEKFTSTLNNFINTFNQSTQKTNDALANQVKIVNQETQAINQATEAQKKYNVEKQKTTTDANNKYKTTSSTVGTKFDNTTTSRTDYASGEFVEHPTVRNIDYAGLEKAQEAHLSTIRKNLLQEENEWNNFVAKTEQSYEKYITTTGKSLLKEDKEFNDFVEKQRINFEKLNATTRASLLQEENEWNSFVAKQEQGYQRYLSDREKNLQKEHQINNAIADSQAKQELEQKRLGTNVGAFPRFGMDLKEAGDYAKTIAGVTAEVTKSAYSYNTAGEQLQTFNVRTKEGGKYHKEYTATLNEATGQTHLFEKGLSDVSNRQLSVAEKFKTMAQSIPLWMVGMTGFMATLHFFTEGIKYVNEFNATLTQIGTAVNYSVEKQAQLAKSFQALGKEISASTADVSKAALEFYRQGLNDEQVLTRLKTTTEYAKISGLEFRQSADLLTAASSSMHTDINKVADVFTLLGDKTATSKHMCSLAS